MGGGREGGQKGGSGSKNNRNQCIFKQWLEVAAVHRVAGGRCSVLREARTPNPNPKPQGCVRLQTPLKWALWAGEGSCTAALLAGSRPTAWRSRGGARTCSHASRVTCWRVYTGARARGSELLLAPNQKGRRGQPWLYCCRQACAEQWLGCGRACGWDAKSE